MELEGEGKAPLEQQGAKASFARGADTTPLLTRQRRFHRANAADATDPTNHAVGNGIEAPRSTTKPSNRQAATITTTAPTMFAATPLWDFDQR